MSDNTPSKASKSIDNGQTHSRLSSIPGSIQEEDEDRNETPQVTRQADSSVRRRDYGALDSSEGTIKQKSTPQRAVSPSGLAQSSPQLSKSQRRPLGARRLSTKRSVPHRGELFSVDDDPAEMVDYYPTLKRTPSMVKRRPTVLPTMSRLEPEDVEEDTEIPVESVESLPEPPDVLDEDLAEELEGEDDDSLSDAESFTLRDRQLAINETHPFGIRIWKPALYKKNRSVEKNAEEDIHSSPSQIVSRWLWMVNGLWTIVFGWWMAAITAFMALVCLLFSFEHTAAEYGRLLWGLAGYLFWPFGKFVKLEQDEQYAEEDEGEGRSISEYERWQTGDLEYGRLIFGPHGFGPTGGRSGSIVGRHRNSVHSASEEDHLLGRSRSQEPSDAGNKSKRRLFGRGQWTLGRIVYFGVFYLLVAPMMLLVSLVCWFFVFTIPMGRVLLILLNHLRKRPLALSFHADASYARDTTKPSSIVLCTYRAAGSRYWKYTVDGTNIFLINFLSVVFFVIVDYYLLRSALGLDFWLTDPALVFCLSLVSIIPLAYFIGQAVASISAQSSMGMGAAVNAFFSTIVEIYLYCVALNEEKGALVEGSVIGSVLAGLLLMPGLSMCFGAIKRKTQRFNVKSAGATTTMLLFAIIATFGPTLFYRIYGSSELICMACTDPANDERDCRRCYFSQVPSVTDDFFASAVRPFVWLAAVCLFLSYVIGLFFTLRTHAAVIWTTELDEKKAMAGVTTANTTETSPLDTRLPSMVTSQQLAASPHPRMAIRESQLYNRILGQSLRSAGLSSDGHDDHAEREGEGERQNGNAKTSIPHLVPPKTPVKENSIIVSGLSEEENHNLVHQVAELAATAATLAARDVTQHPKAASYQATHPKRDLTKPGRISAINVSGEVHASGIDANGLPSAALPAHETTPGGHDAPNWSRTKSSVILLTATVAYALIAEALVDTVDTVLEAVDINEKFLGITLFALVPNTTEFLNAISFAMNGNIALSMEIGSAYVLQVCLIQIPALVLYTAVRGRWIVSDNPLTTSFNMIFPQWDMATVILCVILLSHVYGEGKSNYFKGSILVLTYVVVLLGFWFSGYDSMSAMGGDLTDTLAIGSGGWAKSHGLSNGVVMPKKSEL